VLRLARLLSCVTLTFAGLGGARAGVVVPGTTPPGPSQPPHPGVQQFYTFLYSDPSGNVGSGTLTTTNPSGIDGLSEWTVSGTLVLSNSSDGNASVGDYTLISGGPATTLSPSGLFNYDNLLYPNNDAGNGAQAGFAAITSYLTSGGLLFGPVTGNQDEINIFGNGGGDYAFYSEAGGNYNIQTATGGTFSLTAVPEPGTWALSSVAAIGWVAYWRRRWNGPAAEIRSPGR
jgi:hypothetical protein